MSETRIIHDCATCGEHNCENCGTSNAKCLTRLYKSSRPCCGSCHYTDTHHNPPHTPTSEEPKPIEDHHADTRLFIIPTPETSTELLAQAIREYLTETHEASEDITIEPLTDGTIGITTHWADPDWYETLAEGIENATGALCWIAYRKPRPTLVSVQ